MQQDLENVSAMQQSADSVSVSTDSSQRNCAPSISDQLDSSKELREKQKIVEKEEQYIAEQNIDEELDTISNEIITSENLSKFLAEYFPNNNHALIIAKRCLSEQNIFNKLVTNNQLKDYVFVNLDTELEISSEETAILLKEKLIASGKSEIEVLKYLITTYKNEPELKTFVENWRKFLELWKFAQEKPPQERKAIETIIINTNFTADNSFDLVLSEIEKSSDISAKTKLDINRKFKTTGINTVRAFDYTLKQEKKYKKNIEKKIKDRNFDIENLNNEIQNLKEELDKLPSLDPKRSELKSRIEEKSNLIESYEQELSVLNEAKHAKVQFQLRIGLMGVLNPDGSRSIKIGSENFRIQLPGNNLPLMGMKNLRSINVAFPYLALRSQQISNEIFAPDLVDDGIPTKAQRSMAHTILSSLGIDDSQILSENDIAQLKDDLSHLTNTESGKTGRECLVELGIYDVASQNVNKAQFKKALRFIRENRGENMEFEKLQLLLKN